MTWHDLYSHFLVSVHMKDGFPSHTVVATGSPEVDQPALEQSTRMIWTRDTWHVTAAAELQVAAHLECGRPMDLDTLNVPVLVRELEIEK